MQRLKQQATTAVKDAAGADDKRRVAEAKLMSAQAEVGWGEGGLCGWGLCGG